MKQGFIYAICAYFMWGLLPLYWKLFASLSAWEILSHRIFWSFLSISIVVTLTIGWEKIKQSITNRKQILAIVACSFLIAMNWVIFIWAVNVDRVIETSLGYYINPLINVVAGVLLLKEKLHKGQWVAITVAGLGVSIMAFEYGQVPWVSLSLAVSFALYGYFKKSLQVAPMVGLLWETLIVFPLALIYLMYLQSQGTETFFHLSLPIQLALAAAGIATLLPLLWFAEAAKRLPLSTVGFIQYLAPTTSLLLAIFLFHEPFTQTELFSFSLIWVSLAIYSFSTWKTQAKRPIPKEMSA
ncbi:EamA family transporter RarD [Ammoniphilus sp. YIM 78166]|uniref:EamA family transporter RarD n=1 Tax=Ammoniphilus sp. YIM 78166 TaxID=1644106 RepID=UPI00106F47AA|nr:EamA family transporter RarD [Ammoniphilus sp. YIM 78166]